MDLNNQIRQVLNQHGGIRLAILFTELQAVHLRHDDVEYQQLEILLLNQLPAGLPVIGHADFMTKLLQAPLDERGDVYFIFY